MDIYLRKKLAVFKALSDETRLRVLILLSRQELCVCEIEAILRLSQSRVSRHLTVLRNSGLVLDRRDGTWIHYRLAPARDDLERSLQKCLKECFNDLPIVRKDIKRLREILSRGCETICNPKRLGKKK